MLVQKKMLLALAFLLMVFTFAAPTANAGGKEYKSVVKHLKSKYQAKKVKIPMVWLARFAVRMVRPAGVKSFSITTFENLKFAPETLDAEMRNALANSFSDDWSPIFRVRSRKGEQAYMYMREAKDSVKIMLVTINQTQATVVRAAFNPDKLADFINEPKVFGISLNDNDQRANEKSPESKDDAALEKKSEETKKDN